MGPFYVMNLTSIILTPCFTPLPLGLAMVHPIITRLNHWRHYFASQRLSLLVDFRVLGLSVLLWQRID